MKKLLSFSNLATLFIAGAAAIFFAGCGTVGGLFSQTPSVTPAQTNLTAVVSPTVTNLTAVVTPASTNAAGVLVPPRTNQVASVSPAVTNIVAVVTPASTQTTYAVSPTVQSVLATGQAMAPLAPAPFNGLAEGGLALLSGILGLVAAWKNKQLSAAQKIAAVVQPVVAGVEAAASPAVKAAIQSHAVAAGVQSVLDPIVQAVSQQMPASTPPAPSNAPITQRGA
ncbi:MAG: hypothetical protein KGL39_26080 [Patescibacteria group bacterium]|nr:hypothetical protein [Patescibacteria group bacterium]